MTNGNVGHEFNATRDADVVDAGVQESRAGGHGLVGRDAGHGHGVGGDPVGESRAQGGLTGDVGRLDLLDDDAGADVVHNIPIDSGFVEEA